MWTVVYIAHSKVKAERLRDALTRDGLLVKLRPVGLSKGGGGSPVEVLVPAGEAEEAIEVINNVSSCPER